MQDNKEVSPAEGPKVGTSEVYGKCGGRSPDPPPGAD